MKLSDHLLTVMIWDSHIPSLFVCVCLQILCNDCQKRCTVNFHVLGMKCSGCGSYNTSQD